MTAFTGTRRHRIIAGLYFTLVALTAIAVVWSMRQGWAVFKLRRGVGDTWFYAADGRAWFRMDEQRRDVTLDDIAPDLQHAVIAVEDHRFYRHFGIDPIGLGRAVWRDVRGADRLEGGSTLTQQLARTLFLSNKRTPARKAQEAVLAVLLEQELTKPQILELYLNRIYLSGGVYGVETMSRNLFGKSARAVTLPEAALIAGLIRAPSALSPWSNFEGAHRAEPCGPAADARGRVHHGRSGTGGARRRGCGFVHILEPRKPAGATRRSSCDSSSAIGSAGTIRPTGRCRRRSARTCRTRRSAR